MFIPFLGEIRGFVILVGTGLILYDMWYLIRNSSFGFQLLSFLPIAYIHFRWGRGPRWGPRVQFGRRERLECDGDKVNVVLKEE